MKKTIFLILTLAIPVSVFLFLKLFGTNTFEVPFLFEKGIPDCSNTTAAHNVPSINYIGETEKSLTSASLKGYVIYGVLDANTPEDNKKLIVEFIRIQDAFYEIESPYQLIFVKGESHHRQEIESQCKEMGLTQGSSSIAFVNNEELLDFLKCGIALINQDIEGFSNLVLVDPEKRIRGIYDGLDISQTDQLILEFKILNKNS